MYIIVAKGSDNVQTLQAIRGLEEITTSVQGERIFILRRELKKD